MFLWYKYLIVALVFSHLGFWSGNLSLIAPFPDLCLLVPFSLEWPPNGKIAAHSACGVFRVIVPDCEFGFFPPRFLEWESFSDCAFS